MTVQEILQDSSRLPDQTIYSKTQKKIPSDWPTSSNIDLKIHDLPHESSTTEWWYLNGHLESQNGRQFSVFASFFRVKLNSSEQSDLRTHCHSLTWGVVDCEKKAYYPVSFFEDNAPYVAKQRFADGKGPSDKRIERALLESLDKNHIPLPDRMLKSSPDIKKDTLSLSYDSYRFFKKEDNSYCLEIDDPNADISCRLEFSLKQKIITHGDNGVVGGANSETMFYYFSPLCDVKGNIRVKDENFEQLSGKAWYDHEFGKGYKDNQDRVGWSWVSAQLNNGSQLTVYDLFEHKENSQSPGRWAVYILPNGETLRCDEFELKVKKTWRSHYTFTDFPVAWQLHIPKLNIDLFIEALFPEQEFVTFNSEPSFWEGRVNIKGQIHSNIVEGLGFVELSGFNFQRNLDEFYGAVGQSTRYFLSELVPTKPTREDLLKIAGAENWPHLTQSLDENLVGKILTQPLREIIDRGGKAWRSYALLLCCELVGGNPNDYAHYLALPELLHTGSLIVDDVQDHSTIRRGGASCHEIYGEALAINSGCAAYFLSELALPRHRQTISNDIQVEIYRLYFQALRAAHVGQALDISGMDHYIESAMNSGDFSQLEERLLTIHRFKSAVPARAAAEIGAILGGGTKQQISLIGQYAENLGLAFQIVDDVLNLRGFKKKLKERGEDLRVGKFTFPVVKALSLMPLTQAKEMYQTIRQKPSDQKVIEALITQLEECNALSYCDDLAKKLVNNAWEAFDPFFPDSFAKVRFRAFGFYLLDRHY